MSASANTDKSKSKKSKKSKKPGKSQSKPEHGELERVFALAMEVRSYDRFSDLFKVMTHQSPSIYAIKENQSLSTALHIFEVLVNEGLLLRVNAKLEKVPGGPRGVGYRVSPKGMAYMRETSLAIADACEKFLKNEASTEIAAGYYKNLRIRRLLLDVVLDRKIDLRDAMHLEDFGYVERVPGRKVEVTETGLNLLRGDARGPLPGKGNRTTMITLPAGQEEG